MAIGFCYNAEAMWKFLLPLVLAASCNLFQGDPDGAVATRVQTSVLNPAASALDRLDRVTVDGKEIPSKAGQAATDLGWQLTNGEIQLPAIDTTLPRTVALTIGDQTVEFQLDAALALASRKDGGSRLQLLLYQQNNRFVGADLQPIGSNEDQRKSWLVTSWPMLDLTTSFEASRLVKAQIGPWTPPTNALYVTQQGDIFLPPFAAIEAGGANAKVCLAVSNPQLANTTELMQIDLTQDLGSAPAVSGAIKPTTLSKTLASDAFTVTVPLTARQKVTDLTSPLCP